MSKSKIIINKALDKSDIRNIILEEIRNLQYNGELPANAIKLFYCIEPIIYEVFGLE